MRRTTVNSLAFRCGTVPAILVFIGFAYFGEAVATAQVKSANGLTVFDVQNPETGVDFVNAKALPLPANPLAPHTSQEMVQALLSQPELGTPGYAPGGTGTGIEHPVLLGMPAAPDENEIEPLDYGTSNLPFSTARADLYSVATDRTYPYSAAGKLFFLVGDETYTCSASLIKPGIVVTEAWCVADYGKHRLYKAWRFVPGYRNGSAPFGTWAAKEIWIKSSYYDGTDGCAVSGIVCPDDVALIILNAQSGGYPGTAAGWLGYGWNGFGFTNNGLTHVTELGYPVGLDNAAYMERNDSQGYVNSSDSNNTVIGSNMDGGSGGGPWIINFGLPSALTGETSGSYPLANVVVGVTSWGYTTTSRKEQGASPFTSNNIVSLLNAACSATPAACKP